MILLHVSFFIFWKLKIFLKGSHFESVGGIQGSATKVLKELRK
jgi:hypothetical protein